MCIYGCKFSKIAHYQNLSTPFWNLIKLFYEVNGKLCFLVYVFYIFWKLDVCYIKFNLGEVKIKQAKPWAIPSLQQVVI